MNLILLIVLVGIILFLLMGNSGLVEHFWSRPNKCFDCEKHITSIKNAHLAFPSKCFSCEKQQNQIPYKTGPTKCFSCENSHTKICQSNQLDLNQVGDYFTTFGRNVRMPTTA